MDLLEGNPLAWTVARRAESRAAVWPGAAPEERHTSMRRYALAVGTVAVLAAAALASRILICSGE